MSSHVIVEWIRPPRVLVLDDERIIADTLAQILRLEGCDANAVYSARSALRAIEDEPDLLITDVALDPDSINGVDLAIYYKQELPKSKVLLISGHAGTVDLIARAKGSGYHFRLLHKPVHPNELLSAVCEALTDLCGSQESKTA